ncbi:MULTISPECIES: TRAP transporter large permease [Metabacillus]|uniref:C4-dicarboxylate ABC transporter permease n=2 Tax=Metabacillus TaxID=2675233 RepID=A0A179T5L6_9BACI|nr:MULTISPECIES: TRAP transporter large permease [Metabacillus]OAS89041.1 C4-dicarboxylate ABC transporter permease [Metabacillus litoralis]QNF28561.1 TRAP transporter large permease [Metabacillus sp. KUDC1714]
MTASVALGSVLILCLFVGIPIAVSIGIAVVISLIISGIPAAFLTQSAFTALDSFPLMAIPFFILAGSLMETGGLSTRIIAFANSLMKTFTGGLALVTMMSCLFFAALSGSSPATVAAIGTIMFPAMVKKGYSPEFSAAVSASGGGLGILIPPSIPLIIYGIIANVSISDMFLAGFGPGVIAVLFLIGAIIIISKKRGYTGSGEKIDWKEVFSTFWEAKWALLTPFIILGGVYGGIFTPTESAVIAVIYAFIIGIFVYKELNLQQIKKSIISSSIMTGAILIILSTAAAFSKLIAIYHIPSIIGNFVINLSSNPLIILLLIGLIVLIAGTFMETLSILIIFTPLFLPVVTQLGIDPIHFGIILVIGAEIGLLTPPVGLNLFVASGISKLSIERISIAIIPFILAMVIALVIIILIPQIATFLPYLLKQ